MTKVPDIIIFRIDTHGKSINYASVRCVTDDNELINLFHLRLKVFFVDQVQSFNIQNQLFH